MYSLNLTVTTQIDVFGHNLTWKTSDMLFWGTVLEFGYGSCLYYMGVLD
jgi:hypothetical protein